MKKIKKIALWTAGVMLGFIALGAIVEPTQDPNSTPSAPVPQQDVATQQVKDFGITPQKAMDDVFATLKDSLQVTSENPKIAVQDNAFTIKLGGGITLGGETAQNGNITLLQYELDSKDSAQSAVAYLLYLGALTRTLSPELQPEQNAGIIAKELNGLMEQAVASKEAQNKALDIGNVHYVINIDPAVALTTITITPK